MGNITDKKLMANEYEKIVAKAWMSHCQELIFDKYNNYNVI